MRAVDMPTDAGNGSFPTDPMFACRGTCRPMDEEVVLSLKQV